MVKASTKNDQSCIASLRRGSPFRSCQPEVPRGEPVRRRRPCRKYTVGGQKSRDQTRKLPRFLKITTNRFGGNGTDGSIDSRAEKWANWSYTVSTLIQGTTLIVWSVRQWSLCRKKPSGKRSRITWCQS